MPTGPTHPELLDSVMRATDVMLAFLDPQFNFLWVNPAYAASCRMKPDEMIGRNHFALYPHAENEAIFRKVRDTGEGVFYKDKPFTYPDQPERDVTYWDWSLSPVEDSGGEVTGLVLSLRETTQFKRAAYALQASEAKWAGLLAMTREAFAVVEVVPDAAGRPYDMRFMEFNPVFEQQTGIQKVEALGRTARELFPLARLDALERCLSVALTGKSVCFEAESGQLGRWFDVRVYRIDADHLGLMLFDITERKSAEESLHDLNATLERKVCERTAALQEANERLIEENQERRHTEQVLKVEEARLDALLHLSQIMEAPFEEIASYALEQAVCLTRSRIGFIGLVNEDETVCTVHAVSKEVLNECKVEGNPVRWSVEDAGIWADAIRERRTRVVNDYSRPHPGKKGLPPGHPAIESYMVVPLLESGKVVAFAGVGNKDSGYDQADERQVALLLSGMWSCVRRKEAREALETAYLELEAKVRERTAELAASAEALRRSQRDLCRAQEVGQTGSWRLDLRRNVLDWSDETYRIFGVSPGTPMNYERFLEIVHPEDRALLDARWKAAQRGEPYDTEHRIVVSGAVKWVREKASLEFDETGRPTAGFGIAHDITAMKLAEAAMQQANSELERRVQERTSELETANLAVDAERRQFKNVLDLLPAYLVLQNPDYRIQFANRFFEERFGKAEGRRCHEHIFGRSEPCETCETYKVLESNLPLKWQSKGPDGRNYEIYDFPFADTNGAPLIMEIGLDITERTRAEAAVEAERKRLREVLETLPAMVCLLTPDYHVAFANRSFREQFGEARGRRCYEYCFGLEAPCEFCESYEVLKTGRPHHWEVTTPDGAVIDVHDFPFTDADGSTMILEMDVDITAQRRAESELRTARDALEVRAGQLRALAGELVLAEQRERRRMAKVLHDHLQQLLVGAKFRVTILGRAGDEVIKEGAGEVQQLLDEAIAASRSLTAELSPPVLHDAGLREGLEWLVRSMHARYGLLVDLEVAQGGSPLAEDLRVLLFESVRELLFNAAKHSGKLTAAVEARQVDGKVRIVVSDEGSGFDPSAIRIGERGGGFGLFSIRERLGLVGGRLEVDSAPGKGSRFVLVVPMGEAPPMDRTAADVIEQAGADACREVPVPSLGRRTRILLVDDHVVLLRGLRELLNKEPDIEVVGEAMDGQDALEKAAALLPDLVLMDVNMPRLNGVEATRIIHHDYPDIRIIGLSMFEETERATAMRDAGAVDYVTKSGPAERLLAAIRAAAAIGVPPA